MSPKYSVHSVELSPPRLIFVVIGAAELPFQAEVLVSLSKTPVPFFEALNRAFEEKL